MNSILPNDVASLQSLALTQQSEIEHLKLLVAKLRRMLFGRSSEKLQQQLNQLELYLDEKAQDVAQIETHIAAAAEKRPPSRTGRRPLPAHLPREIITHMPDEPCCSQCGGEFKPLGEDVCEVLEYVPASFKVLRHVRPKLACAKCDAIVQAHAPSRPIPNGLAGSGLLAHVLVSKYCDHLPLYRQCEIYARQSVELDRSTMAEWVAQCHHLLRPLTQAIRRHVLRAEKIHGDDTPVPVLAPGNGQTKQARLWVYVRDDRTAADETPPAVWFAYSPNRRGEHPQAHLKNYRGILQADAFAGYAPLYETGSVREAACWAHVRRRFYDIHQAQASPIAGEALRRIGALYEIERDIRGKAPESRQAQRQARAGPLLGAMREWMEINLQSLSKKSKLAEALRYALTRWRALSIYIDEGRIEIDNSAAERALRCVALGRRNYLFAGSEAGGERAASIYSLIGTAKLNDVEPEAYLRHVIERIADHPVNRVNELLPWSVADKLPNTAH